MIEAMSRGTPVIAWRCGSVPEVIDDGTTGFIVESEDAAVEACGRAAALDRATIRRVFEKRFAAPVMAARYVQVYADMIAADGGATSQLAQARTAS